MALDTREEHSVYHTPKNTLSDKFVGTLKYIACLPAIAGLLWLENSTANREKMPVGQFFKDHWHSFVNASTLNRLERIARLEKAFDRRYYDTAGLS